MKSRIYRNTFYKKYPLRPSMFKWAPIKWVPVKRATIKWSSFKKEFLKQPRLKKVPVKTDIFPLNNVPSLKNRRGRMTPSLSPKKRQTSKLRAYACFVATHKNPIQTKKLKRIIRSEENEYSEYDKKGVFSSENTVSECGLLKQTDLSKSGRNKRRENPLHPAEIKVRRCFNIHFYLSLMLSFIVFICNSNIQACPGRFVNPITDICWSCLFPLTIGPVKVSAGGREDTSNPTQIPCFCPKPPLPLVPGIPIGFWEPVRLVDVTRIPFCMVNMGGLKLGGNSIGYGVHGDKGAGTGQHSFYQVHWYVYPVIYWLNLIVDFLCLEQEDFDVAYITELDPLWNADELSFILNPEAVLFGNPIAQAACAADCVATSVGFPMDTLFWCGGCQGSLYPFTGNNTAHNGGVQASLLLAGRMIAKLHRELLLWETSGKRALCEKKLRPLIKKTQYKTQMTYPRPTTRGPMACNPLGRTEVIWGMGREFPYKGEDFGYLIWRKRSCCVL